MRFTGATELPELPAAAEVVAYRVVVEAVTNLARHAGVDGAVVRLALDEPDRMTVTVSGEATASAAAAGAAAAEPWVPGVGITSMRERVEQIGGVLELDPGRTAGWSGPASRPARPRGLARHLIDVLATPGRRPVGQSTSVSGVPIRPAASVLPVGGSMSRKLPVCRTPA